jgi:UDP-glucose 4-epimerase
VAFFLVFALITYWQAGWSMATSINFMTIYLIITSVILGINYGVVAAFLVSAFNVYSSVANGMRLVTSLYDLNTMLQVVQNFIIGLSIGYVVEQKNLQIEQKGETIAAQASELDYLNTLYDEMGEAKSELEYRLSEYEGSYGKINYIINRLNSLRPEEVFVNSLHVIRELIHEDNLSLYIVDGKMLFLRRIAYIGKECDTLPRPSAQKPAEGDGDHREAGAVRQPFHGHGAPLHDRAD